MTRTTFASVSDALAELAVIISRTQATDPLAPVTILVPSHASGRDVTHFLGRTLNAGAGSAGIKALTLKDLANELIADDPAVTGRRPLLPVLRLGAVSKVLMDEPGLFKDVAGQPATSRAIAKTAELLDAVPNAAGPALPGLMNEVLRIHGAAKQSLGPQWYTDHEAYALAGRKLGTSTVMRRLGTVIGFMLGTEHRSSEAAFRGRLEETGMQHVTASGSAEDGTNLMTASDADDEVRAVVRLVVEKLAGGTPGHRIGIFHSASQPYAALLTQRLDQAGVTFVGPAAHRLTDSPLARALLQLLKLDPQLPDIRAILNIHAEGTFVWQKQKLPSSAVCERLYADPPTEEDAAGQDSAKRAFHLEHFGILRSFVEALALRIGRIHMAATWSEVSGELVLLLDGFMGPRTATERPEKTAAREALTVAASELRHLDLVGPAPRPSLIQSAMEDAITSKGGWTGKSGTGVVIGSYADAVARDLDVLFLLGAAEGLAPARIRENPLLPDSVRAMMGGGLPSVEQRAEASKEQFFAALAAGSERTITYPRGDLRGSGSYQISRWITARPRPEDELQSFAHGIENSAPTVAALPPTAQEWRLRCILTAEERTAALPEDDALQRALAATRDRRDGIFSRFNGNLGAHAGAIVDPEKALSPTRLEDWVTSPFSYFLKHVLKVNILEDAALEVQISPQERGTLVHQILEDYVRSITKDGLPPSADRLRELADAAFAEFANPAWLSHVWERNQAMIRQDLARVLEDDNERFADGWSYLAEEASFGPEDTDSYPPVELALEDGTVVRFRGKVDRIDRHDDGRVRVIDYKTGRISDKYKALRQHPTADGTRYQLPVYGLFAQTLQTSASPVEAEYWFISKAGNFEKIGYTVTDEVMEQLRADAGLIFSALRNGIFPPRPESDRYVNFTTMMGAPELGQQWLKLQNAPELQPYAQLLKAEK
ncbi:PD-(D/E)XK nuclease family protein [Pseudarthrobacter sp. MDT3-26]|uniref:PD-(D/E)XK nuclease family protein n=1 Tax=Pseudarthrobacter raffinosi TaxID=2953651 RepID=UPI00208FB9D2|nr:PD-(D/E)XK nuclease family protein [Pseudarthrobacter sp. MDT3-26]MCO4261500.1 PD-(D/E)XK nuclease family protein [Pseudarthrobacter sp. MDT3-26]